MTLEITNWNISENNTWYVRLFDTGTAIGVGLYTSAQNAIDQTNRNAYGSAEYGTDSDCILTADSGYSISLFQSYYTWHLKVSGQNGDTSPKIYKMSSFTDLEPIINAIYRNAELVEVKSTYEINLHTHSQTVRMIPLGKHITDIFVGGKITFNSTRRNVNEVNQIVGHTITGTVSKGGETRLTSTLKTIRFTTMTKE